MHITSSLRIQKNARTTAEKIYLRVKLYHRWPRSHAHEIGIAKKASKNYNRKTTRCSSSQIQ